MNIFSGGDGRRTARLEGRGKLRCMLDEDGRRGAHVRRLKVRSERGDPTAKNSQIRRIGCDRPKFGTAHRQRSLPTRNGLKFANSLGFHRSEAESDSLQVINFCTGPCKKKTSVRPTKMVGRSSGDFCRSLDLASMIGKISFKHCFCSADQAHVLANLCYCNKNSPNWTGEPPGQQACE